MTKQENSNCDNTANSYCDKTPNSKNLNSNKIQKLKFWWNSKIQIVTKLKKSHFDNSNSEEEFFLTQAFGKNNLTPQQLMRYTLEKILKQIIWC